jgi:hypothetical protein
MIIDAAARFGCAHRWVVMNQDGAMLFVCEQCSHRTDQLPVHLARTRGEVVQFRAFGTSAPETVAAEPARRTARTARATRRRG